MDWFSYFVCAGKACGIDWVFEWAMRRCFCVYAVSRHSVLQEGWQKSDQRDWRHACWVPVIVFGSIASYERVRIGVALHLRPAHQ